MGKFCAIYGCHSGRYADRKEKVRAGLKQKTLFKVPKDATLKSKWSKILNQILEPTDCVCENHFDDSDVIREDRTVLSDGTIHLIPRDRYMLVDNALPINNMNATHSQDMQQLDANGNQELFVENNDQLLQSSLDDTNSLNVAPVEVDFEELLNETWTSEEFVWNGSNDNNVYRTSTPINDNEDNLPDVQQCQTELQHSGLNQTNSPVLRLIDNISENNYEDVDIDKEINITSLRQYLLENPLLEGWSWNSFRKVIVFTLLNIKNRSIRCFVELTENLSVFVHTPDKKVVTRVTGSNITESANIKDVLILLQKAHICEGTGFNDDSRSDDCEGIISEDFYKRKMDCERCFSCRSLRRKIQNRMNYENKISDYKKINKNTKYKMKLLSSQNKRLKEQVQYFKSNAKEMEFNFQNVEKEALQNAILKLPENQQEVVKACFHASETSPNQIRYTIEWMYQCLLMRIKSKQLYEHMRQYNILPLPCRDTVNSYIKNIDKSYGFQPALFESLKLRASRMEIVDKHGILLADEMSISEAIALDQRSMEIQGFVNLGRHTPENQLSTRADHVLVLMFQPLRGSWIQALAAFASKNSVTSSVLSDLLTDAIIQLYKSGFTVDAVTMDGAQWNRGVWTIHRITIDNLSCPHPCDATKKLWFISDFPHLIKCLRNLIMKLQKFWTPDGWVKKDHWEALLLYERYMKPNLKAAYELTPAHINPKGYQTMNCLLAYQLFDKRVAAAMELYQNDPNCPKLTDSGPTIVFIRRLANLIIAMTSRTRQTALYYHDTCKQKKDVYGST